MALIWRLPCVKTINNASDDPLVREVRGRHGSDRLWPTKGHTGGDFAESTAHRGGWFAGESELQLGQKRQFRGLVRCAPGYMEGGSGAKQYLWCLQ
jgi:hypothetical protein